MSPCVKREHNSTFLGGLPGDDLLSCRPGTCPRDVLKTDTLTELENLSIPQLTVRAKAREGLAASPSTAPRPFL